MLGDINKAAQGCEQIIREMEKESHKLEKIGKKLDQHQIQRMHQAEDLLKTIDRLKVKQAAAAERQKQQKINEERLVQEALDGAAKRERARREEHSKANREISRTKAALLGVKSVMAGEVARKVMRGDSLDAGDFTRLAIGSERAMIAVGKKVFGEGALLKQMTEAFRAAPVFGEAISAVFNGFEIGAQEKSEAESIGRRYASGQISGSEYQFFQEMNKEWTNGVLGNPLKILNKTRAGLSGARELSREDLQKAIDKTAPETRVAMGQALLGMEVGKPSSQLRAESIKGAIASAIHDASVAARRALTADEIELVTGRALKSMTDIPSKQREALIDEIFRVRQSKKDEVSGRIKPSDDLFREQQEELKRKWFTTHHRSYSPEMRNSLADGGTDIGASSPEREGYYKKLSEEATAHFLSTYSALSMEHAGHKTD